jgi:NAD(P)-dependent dehydrogenase (short-subunit alcohol dehydrogenase family)
LSLFGIVYLVDQYIPKPLPEPSGVHVGRTVVITGGNSGLGFEAARQLAVKYGVNVVLGCRSKSKCDAAAKLINDEVATSGISMQNKATPLLVDLADMQSVNSFVSVLGGIHVDVLFNNAGYVPDANLPVNKYGEFILLW